MKIAMCSPNMHIGGAEIDLRGMAIELKNGGHDVHVFAGGGGQLMQGYLDNGLTMRSGPPHNIDEDFDVMIVMGPEHNAAVMNNYKGPIVNFVANITPGYYSESIRDNFRIDAHIVDSQNTEERVRSIDPSATTQFWYFMAHPNILQEQTDNTNKFGQVGYDFVAGTLCAHRLVKYVPRLMDAFAKANIPNSVFLVAGNGPETENWKAHAARVLGDRCKFVGVVPPDRLGEFYGCCDVFMNQYVDFAGGRCLTVSEAAGAGCYIITNEHGGAKENILSGNGQVVDDNIFDYRVPMLLREVAALPEEIILDKDEEARAAYRDRYENRPDLAGWVTEFVRKHNAKS